MVDKSIFIFGQTEYVAGYKNRFSYQDNLVMTIYLKFCSFFCTEYVEFTAFTMKQFTQFALWKARVKWFISTSGSHTGRVIRDLLRQLHAVWNSTEALVYSNHSRKAAASSYLAIIIGRIASGVPWFIRSTAVLMQLSHQCWRWCDCGSLRRELSFLLLLWGLSDPSSFSNKLHCEIQVSGSLRPSGHVWGWIP